MALKGHVVTPEHREKISEALLGRKKTKQTREFMSYSSQFRKRHADGRFDYGKFKIVAVITSRWKSTRLPQKALADINGKPMLQHIVDRCRMAKFIDDVIVATTRNSKPIIEYCLNNGINFYPGDEDDILGRLYWSAKNCDASLVVRVWGDAPFISPAAIDLVILEAKGNKADYYFSKNGMTGECIAVIPFNALEKMNTTVANLTDRLWFHSYMLKNGNQRVIRNNTSNIGVKLVVDTPEDLERVREFASQGND